MLAELRRYASPALSLPAPRERLVTKSRAGLIAILKRPEPNPRATGYDVDWRVRSNGRRITRITRLEAETGGRLQGRLQGRLTRNKGRLDAQPTLAESQ